MEGYVVNKLPCGSSNQGVLEKIVIEDNNLSEIIPVGIIWVFWVRLSTPSWASCDYTFHPLSKGVWWGVVCLAECTGCEQSNMVSSGQYGQA
jgi:hypothetical protein